jgi:hypothetical protein
MSWKHRLYFEANIEFNALIFLRLLLFQHHHQVKYLLSTVFNSLTNTGSYLVFTLT